MKNLKTLSAVALAAALFFPLNASRAHAMDLQHARAQKDLSPALQQSLQDKLSDVSGPYFDEQDEKKAKGQIYIDFMQKFEYLPTYGPHNHLVVSCKLGGVEYDPRRRALPRASRPASSGIWSSPTSSTADNGCQSRSPSGKRRTSASRARRR